MKLKIKPYQNLRIHTPGKIYPNPLGHIVRIRTLNFKMHWLAPRLVRKMSGGHNLLVFDLICPMACVLVV